MADYFNDEFYEKLRATGNPRNEVKISTSPVMGELHHTAEMPLDDSLQVPASTSDGGHTIAERAITKFNDLVSDPDKRVKSGDKVVLTIVMGSGRVRYTSRIYAITEFGTNGHATLAAREYHGNWKDNNLSRPQSTIGGIIDLPHGVDVKAQVGYHHTPIEVEQIEVKDGQKEGSLSSLGAFLLTEDTAAGTVPEGQTQPVQDADPLETPSVEDVLSTSAATSSVETLGARLEDKAQAGLTIEPDPSRHTPSRSSTTVIRNRREGFEYAERQAAEAEKRRGTDTRWRARL